MFLIYETSILWLFVMKQDLAKVTKSKYHLAIEGIKDINLGFIMDVENGKENNWCNLHYINHFIVNETFCYMK